MLHAFALTDLRETNAQNPYSNANLRMPDELLGYTAVLVCAKTWLGL